MTRVVVYDPDDHEPITVVEIPIEYMTEIREGKRRHVELIAQKPVSIREVLVGAAMGETAYYRTLRLRFEPIVRGNHRDGIETLFFLAYPDDTELALILRCAFLPGQYGEVQRREAKARFEGLMAGLSR